MGDPVENGQPWRKRTITAMMPQSRQNATIEPRETPNRWSVKNAAIGQVPSLLSTLCEKAEAGQGDC
jgi:hypothetical protein